MIRIAMLSTGEEVLHGDIADTNAAWLSRRFFEQGLALSKRSTVGDQKNSLRNEILALSFNHDVVIVNGGLGPTTDDITAECAAEAAEQSLEVFEDWVTTMKAMFAAMGREMQYSNLKQAMLPTHATIIDNPIGTACGFRMTINEAECFFTPGVPTEFKRMVDDQILPQLQREFPDGIALEVSRIYTFGLSESGIADLLDKLVLPEGFEFGYRSAIPFIEVKLFGPQAEQEMRLQLLKIVLSHLGDNVVSVGEDMLTNIGELLVDAKQTLSSSEIATGGYLSSLLHGNELTASALGQGWILRQPLADSEQDPLAGALALATAIREKTGSDMGLGIGKIDPEQGVAIALSTKQGDWGQLVTFKRHYLHLDQRKLIATIGLDMLRRYKERKGVFGSYGAINRVREMFVPSNYN